MQLKTETITFDQFYGMLLNEERLLKYNGEIDAQPQINVQPTPQFAGRGGNGQRGRGSGLGRGRGGRNSQTFPILNQQQCSATGQNHVQQVYGQQNNEQRGTSQFQTRSVRVDTSGTTLL